MITKSLSEHAAARLADLLAPLSRANKARIIAALLETEFSVGVLARDLSMTEAVLLRQLRGLKQMLLGRTRGHGRHVFYRLDNEQGRELPQVRLNPRIHA